MVEGKLLPFLLEAMLFDQCYCLGGRDVIRVSEMHLLKYACFPPVSDKYCMFYFLY